MTARCGASNGVKYLGVVSDGEPPQRAPYSGLDAEIRAALRSIGIRPTPARIRAVRTRLAALALVVAIERPAALATILRDTAATIRAVVERDPPH